MDDSPLLKLIVFLGLSKCPECKSKNVKLSTGDGKPNECLDCKLKYVYPVRSQLSFLSFLWIGLIGLLVLKKSSLVVQTKFEVYSVVAVFFVVSTIVMFLIANSKKYEVWSAKQSRANVKKFYITLFANLATMFGLFQLFGT